MNTGMRYASVDALRGLIMMLMAIDHASALIARQHASEFWAGAMSAYDGWFPFLTRWVTHLCAPGFFFLMGAGIYWLAAVQRERGVADGVVMRKTALRGFSLFVLAQVVEMPLLSLSSLLKPASVSLNRVTAPPPNDGTTFGWALITLSCLGLTMMICSLLLRLRPVLWLVVAAGCVIATHAFLPASGQPGGWWQALLLRPGLADHLLVVYSVVPWLAGTAAGMYFGYWWRRNPGRAERRVWLVGALLLAAGVAVRTAGGWGNIRPPRDTGWIEFLNNVKYPPSFVFWTVMLGLNLLLLTLFARANGAVTSHRSPFIVFGQTPLFFYVAHFLLLTALAFAFFREPSSLSFMYVVWAAVLVMLYPLCAWYRNFKMSRPRDSFWRMF